MATPAPDSGVMSVTSGTRNLIGVNPGTWTWYEIPLEEYINGTTVYYNAVVEIDSESLVTVAGEDTWASMDVMILNGTLPGNAFGGDPPVIVGDPQCFDNAPCFHDYSMWFRDQPRITASVGYNYTAPGGMTAPLTNLVVGVREANQYGAIEYSIKVTRLPRVLTDGLVLDSSVAPCKGVDEFTCRQYFELPVTGYDIVELRLERMGDNITYVGEGGVVRSNGGRGLVGDLYVATAETYLQPPPLAYDVRRNIDNVTAEVSAGYFCTLPSAAGTYTIAIVGGDEGGFGAELLTSPAEQSIDLGVARQGRGRFRLHVRHAQFHDGTMSTPTDARPGCVSYGQTRNYTLASTGMGDANLFVEVSGGNVSAIRARCDGCDWVEATPPISALAASPCNQRNSTTWEVELRLDDLVPATLAGLGPTEFAVRTELLNATMVPGERLLSRSEGGRGYVCCGAVQNYILPDVDFDHAPAFELNLSSGSVRAAFLKHDECAAPVADVDGAACTGLCEMTWLTVYDEFYGAMEHTSSRHLSIPFGPEPWNYDASTTKRRGGDWYISIWSLPGQAAEYSLEVFHRKPPRPPDVYRCTRFDQFCPEDHYHMGMNPRSTLSSLTSFTLLHTGDISSATSAATAGHNAAGAWVAGMLLAALTASRLLYAGGRSR